MSEALVVPVRVEALPVGDRDTYTGPSGDTAARVVPPYADFAALVGRFAPYVGAQVVSRLFTGGRPLDLGVHVHWHLPRALLRTPVEAEHDLAPAAAPDRWLVTRMVHAAAEPPTAHAWVVESNHLASEPLYSETTFPEDPAADGPPYAYLGRVYTLDEWLAEGGGGRYHPGLTAFGYGIPDFAACYSNCRNVFGLHDRGLGTEPGLRTLTYAVVGWHDDPALDPLAGGCNPSTLGWQGSGPGPRRTLYFGSIHGVPYDPGTAHSVRQRSPLTPDVAVGNTPAEALSALAADGDRHRERLFTAYQLGALRRLGALAHVEEQVHTASFASTDAGAAWDVRATEGDVPAELSAGDVEALGGLNALQREYDARRARLTALRRRVFADWYRRAQLRAARWRHELDLDGLDELIEAQLRQIGEMEGEVAQLRERLEAWIKDLRADLPAATKLVETPASRFYRPNDPVVLLAGDGIVAPAPDARDDVDCVQASALPEPPQVEGIDAADRLPHAEAGRLVRQALAFGPDAAGLPAPEIAQRKWTLPWRPIEIAWRVALQLPDELDTPAELGRDVVLENYALRPGLIDFDPINDAFDVLPDEYEGRAPVAANASAALEVLLEGRVDEALLQRLRDRPLIAQALGGFTPALTMLDQNLQLPVADPDGSPLDADFVARVAAGVGDQARFAPVPDNPFAPIRGGRFRITSLRLVDEFGRWRDVDTSAIVVSETIPRHEGAMLPPLRLTQPAQLGFRWRVARTGTEASRAPAGSPICGWVVPNRLDNGIMLYDGDGSALGRFTPGTGEEPPQWFGAPGTTDPTGTVEDALVGRNDVIAGFARSLVEHGAAYLQAFCATVATAHASIAPRFAAADQALAVLVGEPLVLVQAELDLSLLGLPSIDMSLRALRDDIGAEDPLQRTDKGITQVRFPVLLGNPPAVDDGLIGFYLPRADGTGTDFNRFYATAHGDHDAIARPAMDTITVVADPDATPLVVTMLVDPRCAVHATTGILPVKALAVPGEITTQGMAALDYTFLTGPLIVPPDAVSVPAPAAVGRWQWIGRVGDEWPRDAVVPFDPTAVPLVRQRIVDGWLKLDRSKAPSDQDGSKTP